MIRRQVIATVGMLLRKQGYNGTGINQIIQESQIPKGSLYHAFPAGKSQIALEALRLSSEIWLKEMDSILARSSHPSLGIRNFCKYLADELAGSKWQMGSPFATVTLEVASSMDRIQSAASEHYQNWESILMKHFQEKKVSTSKELIHTILSGIEGALILCRAYRKKDPLLSLGKIFEDLLKR